MSLADFEKIRPERVDVKARIQKSGYVPNVTILTTSTDRLLHSQRDFISWARDNNPSGEFNLIISDERQGHTVTPTEELVQYL